MAPPPPAPACRVGCSCKVLSLSFLKVCPAVGKGRPQHGGGSAGLAMGTFIQQVPTALGKGTRNGTGAGGKGGEMVLLVRGAKGGAGSVQTPAGGVSTRGPRCPRVPISHRPHCPTSHHPRVPITHSPAVPALTQRMPWMRGRLPPSPSSLIS